MLDDYEMPAGGFAALERPGVLRQAAIVDRKDFERNFRFCETVARNRGFNVRFFTEVEDAMAWVSEGLEPASG
ncbi:MAG: hypothetical protein E3J64_06480 [Anaerolineales bacterium]|nr:MAG: hypothetical protein E3J64_06480 [Anaerolineales bacterium]